MLLFSVLIASIRLLFTAPTSFDPYATCTSLDLVIEHPYAILF